MNWVSGKTNVWVLEVRKGSSVPSSFTSTMWRRGWYLCSDCSTIICIPSNAIVSEIVQIWYGVTEGLYIQPKWYSLFDYNQCWHRWLRCRHAVVRLLNVFFLLLYYLSYVVRAAFVIGKFQFAKGNFLSHPVIPSVGGVWVHIHSVSCKKIIIEV